MRSSLGPWTWASQRRRRRRSQFVRSMSLGQRSQRRRSSRRDGGRWEWEGFWACAGNCGWACGWNGEAPTRRLPPPPHRVSQAEEAGWEGHWERGSNPNLPKRRTSHLRSQPLHRPQARHHRLVKHQKDPGLLPHGIQLLGYGRLLDSIHSILQSYIIII